MPRKIVIIGANAAGSGVASAARKTDREAEITIIEREKYPAYSRCGLPFVLAGEISEFEKLIIFPLAWYKMMKLNLLTETTVQSIDVKEKSIMIKSADGKESTLPYDTLVLATGARSFIPPVKGYDKDGVLALRTIQDGIKFKEKMKSAKAAVIVGAGFIGLETAHALFENKINPIIVEMLPWICPTVFDQDTANIVQKKIEEHGIKVIVGKGVEEILGDTSVTGVKVAGETIPADMVLMATGVRSNTELAVQMGVELGITKAIKVNSRMATNISDVYSCGDCVESQNMLTGLIGMCQLGTTAVRQAKVAGTNAAGGYSVFPGVLGSSVSTFFGVEIGATGLTEFQATRLGLKPISGVVTSKTRADYFPGAKDIRVKIVAEPEFGRIIGCQIVAGEEVTQRVNMISAGIQKQMTIFELAKADTCYAPPVNETWEPIALAAEMAVAKLRR
ncbi:MAG: hypothetical protein QG670_2437 [Thermoproteota archaeon]|nr:hypothetical protein [Thermoproteota archaeon]